MEYDTEQHLAEVKKALDIMSEVMQLNTSIDYDIWLDACLCIVMGGCVEKNQTAEELSERMDDLKAHCKFLIQEM